MHIFLYNHILPYDELLLYMCIYIYTCINLEFNIYYIQRFTMIHPLYVMVFPKQKNLRQRHRQQSWRILCYCWQQPPDSVLNNQSMIILAWQCLGSVVIGSMGFFWLTEFFLDQGNTRINGLFSPTYTVNGR